MRFLFWLPVLSLSLSCMSNQGLETEARATDNIYRLHYVEKGMSELEVRNRMGDPYDKESYVIEEDRYDTWFYITKPTVLGQSRMVPQNLTPLTFLNGSLVGWGYPYYNDVRSRYEELNPSLPVSAFFFFSPSQEASIFAMAKKEKEPPPESQDPPNEEEDPLDKRDDRMLEEEKEQDFDYW